MKKKVWLIVVLVVVGFLASLGIQFAINMGIDPYPSNPTESINSGGSDRLLYHFYKQAKGEALPEGIELTDAFVAQELSGTFEFVNARYDTSDFRVNALVRLYLSFRDEMSQSNADSIKTVLLNFKYWMDQGGTDSMCYWSENHQILFSVSEYLVGQTFPDEVFAVDGKTGAEHMAMASERVEAWMRERYLYGFTEWYSNNYYPEDIGPMANFIQFAEDEDLVLRMKMIMDLIWYDMASQSFKYSGVDAVSGTPRDYYVFVVSSGRMYSDNRASDDTGNRMRNFIDYVIQPDATRDFENSWYTYSSNFFNCFRQMLEATDDSLQPYYEVPGVIKDIFNDSAEEKTIRSSQSLDVEELKTEGLLGTEDPQIMMQWDMEAFSNPAVIDNTLKYMAQNDMFTNEFLNDFKLVNLWPLRALGLLGAVSDLLKPSTNGVAIERANVYTYKTDVFSMSTAQAYQPGEYADQQAISEISLSNQVSVFTTQPAKIPRRSGTPTYWVGNGRQPYSVQEKNVLIEIYQPPTKVGFMEPMIVAKTTHIFFPQELFDQVDESYLDQGYIFGRVGKALIAIKARYALDFVEFAVSDAEGDRDDMIARGNVKNVLTEKYDLVQYGEGDHYFVTKLSSTDKETFADFIARFLAGSIEYDETSHTLSYATTLYGETSPSTLLATYDGDFVINDTIEDLQYQRFESPYVDSGIVDRKAGQIYFTFNDKGLLLDYDNLVRTITD